MTASSASQNTAALSIRGIAEELLLASENNVPVLITAASPDDRETCARIIHGDTHSSRSPFIKLDGGSLGILPAPAGVPTGAYDGGDPASTHRLERASGGTLYVDNITELDGTGQAQLLDWLEQWRQVRLSSGKAPNDSIRLIAGARRHLDRERASGAFSERLFYRLNMIHVDLTGSQEMAIKARGSKSHP